MKHVKKRGKKTLMGELASATLIILFFSFITLWVNKLSTNAAIPVTAINQNSPQQEEISTKLGKNFENPEDTILDVPYLSQEGILPTGCEVTSAAMVLQYWGVDIRPEALADMLPCEYLFWEDGLLYGPDPNEFFVGSPFDPNSYGCYAPVIASVIPEADDSMTTQVLSHTSLEELYEKYVLQGIPILIWCTIQMLESSDGTSWILPDGEEFVWRRNEHCMVLIGRKGEDYICLDPYESIGQRAIDGELLEKRYQELGEQAVVVLPKEEVME